MTQPYTYHEAVDAMTALAKRWRRVCDREQHRAEDATLFEVLHSLCDYGRQMNARDMQHVRAEDRERIYRLIESLAAGTVQATTLHDTYATATNDM